MMTLKKQKRNRYEVVRFGIQNNKPVPAMSVSNVCKDDTLAFLLNEGVDEDTADIAFSALDRPGVIYVSFKDCGELSYILEDVK